MFDILNNDYDKYVSKDFSLKPDMRKKLITDIINSKPNDIIPYRNSIPILVINPKPNSDFVLNAYFLPTIWIIPVRPGLSIR